MTDTADAAEYDRLDRLVDEDPIALRDHAWRLLRERDEARQQLAVLRKTLAEILAQFHEKGHPGEPCIRTGWIRESTIVAWHKTYRETMHP